jgi:hypothetical protein
MNRQYKKEELQFCKLPLKIDSFGKTDDGYMIEYDGWHFEAKTQKMCVDKVLKYIFKGGEE